MNNDTIDMHLELANGQHVILKLRWVSEEMLNILWGSSVNIASMRYSLLDGTTVVRRRLTDTLAIPPAPVMKQMTVTASQLRAGDYMVGVGLVGHADPMPMPGRANRYRITFANRYEEGLPLVEVLDDAGQGYDIERPKLDYPRPDPASPAPY